MRFVNARAAQLAAVRELAHTLGGIFCASVLFSYFGTAPVQAQTPTPQAPAVLLADPRAEAPHQSRPAGRFEQRTVIVRIDTATVRLASTPDGAGELCTDDQVDLTLTPASGPALHWTHQFASADRRSIVCIAPQSLELPAGPGSYTVTMTLDDLYPDTFGTRAYYLIAGHASLSQSAIAPARGSTRATQPSPTLTHIAPSATPSRGSSAAATAAPMLAAEPKSNPEVTGMNGNELPILMLIGVAVLLGVLGLVLLVRRRPAGPHLQGVLYLYEPASREARTIALSGDAAQLDVRRRPLGVASSGAMSDTADIVARLQATPNGPILFDARAPNEPIALQHDRSYALADGLVTLRYRGGVPLDPVRMPAQRPIGRYSTPK